MLNCKKLLALVVALVFVFSVCGCNKVDENYGLTSELIDANKKTKEVKVGDEEKIMSLDTVMSNFFDISEFDEENYADIYLGSDFVLDAKINGTYFEVPEKLNNLAVKGWVLSSKNTHDKNSTVFSHQAIELGFENEKGKKLTAQIYNSDNSGIKLWECNIVKFTIKNDYYKNPKDYIKFDVNGITNSMSITDIVTTLGTPSHFYPVSDTEYYLDYFISKKDRRNGITVYVSTVDDAITKIEFSYYK